MDKHFLLVVDQNTVGIGDNLPNLTFPKMLRAEDKDFELAGYFVNYDKSCDDAKVFAQIKNRGFKDLVNSNSEFLLFFLDKRSKRLLVGTDQFGKFPCYFSLQKGRILFSSSFSLIKKQIQCEGLSLDFDSLFSSAIWDIYSTERTFIKEINRIPSGCVGDFLIPNLINISSYVDLEKYLANRGKSYESILDFSRDWLATLQLITEARLEQVGRLKFTCDLSSGFDCTLVAYCLRNISNRDFKCYSKHSPLANDETNLELMQKFAKSHSLKLETIDVSQFYAQTRSLEKLWNTDEPYQFTSTDQNYYFSKLGENGVKIRFTGDGGDEIYSVGNMDVLSGFPIQNSFFGNVSYFKKFGLERFFSKDGISYALSNERFNKRKAYPLIVSTSAAAVFWFEAEYHRKFDCWPMTPYMDTRLVSLARRMPKSAKGNKQMKKMLTLRNLPQVFSREMFKEKAGLDVNFINFVKNQKSLISSILENSVFAKMGWVSKDKIIKMLNDEKSELFTNTQFAIVLETMTKLEWFIQKNKVRF